MIDKKIIYRDPNERQIVAIIDLGNQSKISLKTKTMNFNGRNVQQLDGDAAHRTIKKLDCLSKKKIINF